MMLKTASMNTILAVMFGLALALFALAYGGCGGDDTSCMATENCPDDTDAGDLMTADADPTTPDADTTPDANNGDPCADYAGVPSDGWQCTSYGSPNFDINNLQMIVENGVCILHSQQIWCANNDTPPASDVVAGQFTCTDINGGTVTCWHN